MTGFCLVGAGFIGPVHAANIAAHPAARLEWVVDLDAKAHPLTYARMGYSNLRRAAEAAGFIVQ